MYHTPKQKTPVINTRASETWFGELTSLGLIHHLAIGGNVPLDLIARYFRSLGAWAVVEFIPKDDKKTQLLLANREDVFPNYTQENFENDFGAFFEIESIQKINDSERTLYLMQGK